MRVVLLTWLVCLAAACGSDTRDTICGHKAPNDPSCQSGQYCVCYAGAVAVDEHDYPGCVQPTNEADDSIQLNSGGDPGACQPCSYPSYCGAGRTWDVTSCSCQPPLATVP